ncbi:pimeloyl-ACP methyl ester carboxylesterase [Streptomyces sp. TLI_55]|uniref:alpha/beta fold hydrolase n=1 Tax=Streptomyces sp. TLI_55 TaxID=1938861 RepID=UPI000BCC39E0|nr:alpha/beta hydrolase [Streptomyces sp. TLI_55]SNX88369.1 pimeloyl-ACP methyl ester carboxylesterase [Streptomyces sp. TLI_55]
MLAYDVHGSGPGLVLLPGVGGTSALTWETLLAGLAAEHAVVLADLPGAGRSPLPVGRLELDTLADQVVATAERAGLGDFVIAGPSLGAAVAITAAARHPDRVRAVITLSGFARPQTSLWLGLETWASLLARPDGTLHTFLTRLAFSEEYLAGRTSATAQYLASRLMTTASGTARQIALALSVDLRRVLPTVMTPTLVVAAAADRFVAPQHSVDLANGLPGARLAAVPGGHAATVEEPLRTLEILTSFLRDLRSSPTHRPAACAHV